MIEARDFALRISDKGINTIMIILRGDIVIDCSHLALMKNMPLLKKGTVIDMTPSGIGRYYSNSKH